MQVDRDTCTGSRDNVNIVWCVNKSIIRWGGGNELKIKNVVLQPLCPMSSVNGLIITELSGTNTEKWNTLTRLKTTSVRVPAELL